MAKKVIIAVVVIALIIVGAQFLLKGKDGTVANVPGLSTIANTIGAKSNAFPDDLMSYIPESATSVTSCDYGSPSSRAFIKSSGYQTLNAFLVDRVRLATALATYVPDEKKRNAMIEIAVYFGAYNQAVAKNPGGRQVVAQLPATDAGAVGFWTTPLTEEEFPLDALIAKINELGVTIGSETIDGIKMYDLDVGAVLKSYSGTPPTPDAPPAPATPATHYYMGRSGDRFAFGTHKEVILPFLKREAGTHATKLLTTPHAQEILSSEPYNADKHICYTYSDVQGSLGALRTIIDQIAAQKGATDPAQLDFITKITSDFPIKGGVSTFGYDNGIEVDGAWSYQRKTADYDLGPWIDAFKTKGEIGTLVATPNGGVLSLALNVEPLGRVQKILQEKNPEMAPMLAMAEPYIQGLHGLGLNILLPEGGSPFPSVAFIARSSNAAGTAQIVKTLIDASMQKNMGAAMPWETKDVGGVSVNYIQTPLGVGVYIGTKDNLMLVASSEEAMKKMVDVSTAAQPGLRQALDELKHFNDQDSLLYTFVDFKNLSLGLQTMQGTMSMMSGGQASVPPEVADLLMNLGSLSFRFALEDKVIRYQVRTR
jgi:hypothetical protein